MKISFPRLICPRLLFLCLAIGGCGETLAQAQQTENEPQLDEKKAALFVLNRAANIPEQNAQMLEDLLVAQIAQTGFQVLTRDVMSDSLERASRPRQTTVGDDVDAGLPSYNFETKNMSEQGALAAHEQFLEFARNVLKGQRTHRMPAKEDFAAELYSSTSVMRLAQTFGANLIVIAVIESFGTERREFLGNDVAPATGVTTINKLMVTYRYCFAATGGAVAGDRIVVSRTWGDTAGLKGKSNNILHELCDQAATELGARIRATSAVARAMPQVRPVQVEFKITPVMPGGAALQLPVFNDNRVALVQTPEIAADVILDGTAIGSASSMLQILPGLHQIELRAAGFLTWKRNINVFDGQRIEVRMEMTKEGYADWKDSIEFLREIGKKARLTEAELQRVEAETNAMKRGGIRFSLTREGLQFFKADGEKSDEKK